VILAGIKRGAAQRAEGTGHIDGADEGVEVAGVGVGIEPVAQQEHSVGEAGLLLRGEGLQKRRLRVEQGADRSGAQFEQFRLAGAHRRQLGGEGGQLLLSGALLDLLPEPVIDRADLRLIVRDDGALPLLDGEALPLRAVAEI
jgi:hypothetical protein